MSAPTASANIAALAELRPLLPPLGRVARAALARTIEGIEAELKEDIVELRQLVALSETQTVGDALREQVAAIEAALASTAAEPASGASVSGKGGGTAAAVQPPPKPAPAPAQKSAPAPPAPAATAAPSGPPPLDTRPRAPPAPTLDAPRGGFDPHAWPEVTSTEHLLDDCFRSAHEPMREVPRCPFGSKAAKALMEQRKPVILTHHKLVSPAVGKWSLDFLCSNMAGQPCTVYASDTRHFRYWDEEKNEAGYAFGKESHTEKISMPIDEFRRRLAEGSAAAATGGAAAAAAADGADGKAVGGKRLYLQTALVDGVGQAMMADFKAFDWDGLLATQQKLGWGESCPELPRISPDLALISPDLPPPGLLPGELSSNLLLIGQSGNTTPCHYDEQQNLFAQLHGSKRVVLFSPADFGCLYPFPLHHPSDRQSQVDLYHPDLRRFPKFAHARPLEAVLRPGDVLYLPQYWWHHIENLDDECVSLNFWFKDMAKPEKVVLPLTASQHLAMRRNIERLLAQRLGARQAQAVLPLLAQPGTPPPPPGGAPSTENAEAAAPEAALVAALREEVTRLLGHVMKEEEVGAWLIELAEGRFDGLV